MLKHFRWLFSVFRFLENLIAGDWPKQCYLCDGCGFRFTNDESTKGWPKCPNCNLFVTHAH